MNTQARWCAAATLLGTLALAPVAANAVVVTAGCADATFCAMDELIAGGSITIDDKRFFNFRDFTSTATNNSSVGFPVDLPLNASDIKVHSQFDYLGALGVPDEIGLAFDIDSGGSNIVLLDGGQTFALGWRYDVEVLDPSRAIVDNTLLLPEGIFLGASIANIADTADGAALTVIETLTESPLVGPFVRKTVSANANGDAVMDHRDFAPITQFTVDTSITAFGGTELTGTNLSLDLLVQSFSQTEVPAPGTLMLLALGLAGFGVGRRKAA
jgi:hypothetical protein